MPTKTLTLADIFDQHQVHFDPGDQRNGSLYICIPESSNWDPVALLQSLREGGLWSAEAARQVRPDQRDAYKSQLDLVTTVIYMGDAGHFKLVRCTHPTYPSDAERWSSWLQHLDNQYQRL